MASLSPTAYAGHNGRGATPAPASTSLDSASSSVRRHEVPVLVANDRVALAGCAFEPGSVGDLDHPARYVMKPARWSNAEAAVTLGRTPSIYARNSYVSSNVSLPTQSAMCRSQRAVRTSISCSRLQAAVWPVCTCGNRRTRRRNGPARSASARNASADIRHASPRTCPMTSNAGDVAKQDRQPDEPLASDRADFAIARHARR